ncbi:uncharacterized protein LOC133830588 [Humulus lupulus]|uniref:uncharacterized protein LOC133830588 n=1 Tax=Humulus lupulus TaxID=3486 RepID=UPI002B404D55|nr:uncharacterized protein LOC133830588 [Humulus lupulus]
MINYCLYRRRSWKLVDNFAQWFRVTKILDSMKTMVYSKSETVPDYLKEFIFDELRIKSSKAKTLSDVVKASKQRGNSALSRNSSSYAKLKWSVSEFQYGESLLVWHLATELCQMIRRTGRATAVMGRESDTCAEVKRYLNNNVARV